MWAPRRNSSGHSNFRCSWRMESMLVLETGVVALSAIRLLVLKCCRTDFTALRQDCLPKPNPGIYAYPWDWATDTPHTGRTNCIGFVRRACSSNRETVAEIVVIILPRGAKILRVLEVPHSQRRPWRKDARRGSDGPRQGKPCPACRHSVDDVQGCRERTCSARLRIENGLYDRASGRTGRSGCTIRRHHRKG